MCVILRSGRVCIPFCFLFFFFPILLQPEGTPHIRETGTRARRSEWKSEECSTRRRRRLLLFDCVQNNIYNATRRLQLITKRWPTAVVATVGMFSHNIIILITFDTKLFTKCYNKIEPTYIIVKTTTVREPATAATGVVRVITVLLLPVVLEENRSYT